MLIFDCVLVIGSFIFIDVVLIDLYLLGGGVSCELVGLLVMVIDLLVVGLFVVVGFLVLVFLVVFFGVCLGR